MKAGCVRARWPRGFGGTVSGWREHSSEPQLRPLAASSRRHESTCTSTQTRRSTSPAVGCCYTGHNTSGKTKALELLLPFCLDGDISPSKLDPFGSIHKDVNRILSVAPTTKSGWATCGSSSSVSTRTAAQTGSRSGSGCGHTRRCPRCRAGTSSRAIARSAPTCRCCVAASRSAEHSSRRRSATTARCSTASATSAGT